MSGLSDKDRDEKEGEDDPMDDDGAARDDDEGDSDDGDDDDDDDEDEEEEEEEDDDSDADDAAALADIERLRTEVAVAPTAESLVRLASLLNAQADLDGVRKVREMLATSFCPVDDAAWLEWVDDEERLARTDAERTALEQLCLRACRDHLSVPLWLRYVHMASSQAGAAALLPGCGPDEDPPAAGDAEALAAAAAKAASEAVSAAAPSYAANADAELLPSPTSPAASAARAGVEAALTAAGLHHAEGGAIWSTLECIELRLLRGARARAAAEPSAKPAVDEQIERVRAVYRRRLVVPLLDFEIASARYEAWEGGLAPGEGEGGGKGGAGGKPAAGGKAYAPKGARGDVQRELAKRRRLELRLASARRASAGSGGPWGAAEADGGTWPIWCEYLALEGTADPWRTRVLYERLLGPGETAAAASAAQDGDGAAGGTVALHRCAWAWARYLRFLWGSLPSPELLRAAAERAVRCCPASTALQVELLRCLEHSQADPPQVQAAFEAGLGAPLGADGADGGGGVDEEGDAALVAAAGPAAYGGSGHLRLLFAYSHYQRRRASAARARGGEGGEGGVVAADVAASVRAARDAVLGYRAAYLLETDPEGALARLWMACEAEVLGDLGQARLVAEQHLLGSPPTSELAAVWAELAELEGRHGGAGGGAAAGAGGGAERSGAERCRGVYRRALGALSDGGQSASLQAAWLDFEARAGSMAQLRDAELRCAERTRALWSKQLQRAAAVEAAAAAEAEAEGAKKTAHNQQRKQKQKAKKAESKAADAAAPADTPAADMMPADATAVDATAADVTAADATAADTTAAATGHGGEPQGGADAAGTASGAPTASHGKRPAADGDLPPAVHAGSARPASEGHPPKRQRLEGASGSGPGCGAASEAKGAAGADGATGAVSVAPATKPARSAASLVPRALKASRAGGGKGPLARGVSGGGGRAGRGGGGGGGGRAGGASGAGGAPGKAAGGPGSEGAAAGAGQAGLSNDELRALMMTGGSKEKEA